MPLSAPALGALIDSNLQAVGAKGSNKTKFCNAVARGIVNSIIGVAFATTDAGTTPGFGVGTGIGITGLSSSAMKSMALSLMSTKGENADKLMQAIMNATVIHLSTSASLSSVNSPVFLGTGTIILESIAVVSATMISNIDSELQGIGANGTNRAKLARAIGTGIASNIVSSGSGTVVITGTPVGAPTPGTGSGTGTIS